MDRSLNFALLKEFLGHGTFKWGLKTQQLPKPWNRNPDLEVLFFPHLMLRFPPIWLGSKSHLDHFHRPSKSGFLFQGLLLRL